MPARAVEGRPATTAVPPSAAVPADATAALRDEILRLVGTAPCRDDSQCRALPIGNKPCGGPEGYVAWSTAATDGRALEAAAARYKLTREQRNRELGLMSDCAVVPEPAVRCMPVPAGRCETVRGPAGLSPGLR